MDAQKENTSCAVDTGLALGLSIGGLKESEPSSHHAKKNPNPTEPSLTLSLPESTSIDTTKLESETPKYNCVLSPPQSAVSYIQGMVKRERETDVLSNNSNSRISEEDEDGGARKKLRLTKEQSALLEDRFKEHTTLNPKQKLALAKQLNLTPRQVEVWFQNRRARTKLKQTEVDCEFLKRCCETLTEENRRLQKELQELRTVKFVPSPLYMQFPTSTLTLCPSCERIGGGSNTDSKERDGSKPSNGSVQFKSHFYNPFTHSATC